MPNGQPAIQIAAHQDQLVVDLDQVDKILEILEHIPVTWSSVQKNKTLELALITVDDVIVPAGYTGGADKYGVDRLIHYLRETYEAETGEALTIGKNRIIGSIVGSPYTGGGEGIPQPYTGGGAGVPQPYTGGGAGIPQPYTGGALIGGSPYTGSGSGPYTGGALTGIQVAPPTGALPNRTEPPGKGVGVGILDTRLFAHPDLAGRYLASHGTLAAEIPARPPNQDAHATFIAGVVLEWAPNANLIVDHVLNEGDISTSSWQVATKMARFAEAGVKVLNISFGAATDDNKAPLVLRKAVEALGRRGVIVVAAAGNNGPDITKIWPAALAENDPNVVAVGAGMPNGSGGFLSAVFSPDAPWVGMIAPGENIYSTYKASGYATWNGTSFAAAAVSGAIALLVQTQGIDAREAVDWLKTRPANRKDPRVTAVINDIGPR